METPQSTDELDLILEHGLELSEEVRAMVRLFAMQEFRRGYLYGRREMKLHVESVIAGIRIDEE